MVPETDSCPRVIVIGMPSRGIDSSVLVSCAMVPCKQSTQLGSCSPEPHGSPSGCVDASCDTEEARIFSCAGFNPGGSGCVKVGGSVFASTFMLLSNTIKLRHVEKKMITMPMIRGWGRWPKRLFEVSIVVVSEGLFDLFMLIFFR